jgi:hypothetical protein
VVVYSPRSDRPSSIRSRDSLSSSVTVGRPLSTSKTKRGPHFVFVFGILCTISSSSKTKWGPHFVLRKRRRNGGPISSSFSENETGTPFRFRCLHYLWCILIIYYLKQNQLLERIRPVTMVRFILMLRLISY